MPVRVYGYAAEREAIMNLPVAAQVYSVRDEAAADFEKTMLRLAKMGYDGVELAGLYGK